MTDPNTDPKMAAAEAKAAKAKAKALRPWFKKKRFIVPIVLVVLIGLSRLGGSSDPGSDNSSAGDDKSSSSQETQIASIGDTVTDGSFSFTVGEVSCGHDSVGTELLGRDAQGQFCFISVNVENVGTDAQTLFGENQKLFDSEGREFSPDTTAAIYMGQEASTIWEEINRGNSIDGILVFDVPTDVTLDKIELHDSAFSGGVEVSLN